MEKTILTSKELVLVAITFILVITVLIAISIPIAIIVYVISLIISVLTTLAGILAAYVSFVYDAWDKTIKKAEDEKLSRKI